MALTASLVPSGDQGFFLLGSSFQDMSGPAPPPIDFKMMPNIAYHTVVDSTNGYEKKYT